MSTLIIYFCGTGNPGRQAIQSVNDISWEDDVSYLHVWGCADEAWNLGVGIFPDLSKMAKKMCELFSVEENSQDTDEKQQHGKSLTIKDPALILGDRIYTVIEKGCLFPRQGKKITDIVLLGYSRGAVTAYILVKQLNAYLKKNGISHVSIYLGADNPVPGNVSPWVPNSNAMAAQDLSGCEYLKKAFVILGDYHNNSLYFRTFYTQQVPRFPPHLKKDEDYKIRLSSQHHHLGSKFSEKGKFHLFHWVSKELGFSRANNFALMKIQGRLRHNYLKYSELRVTPLDHAPFGMRKESADQLPDLELPEDCYDKEVIVAKERSQEITEAISQAVEDFLNDNRQLYSCSSFMSKHRHTGYAFQLKTLLKYNENRIIKLVYPRP